MKFPENSSIGSRVIPCGQTDGWTDRRTGRHDEANIRFLQFCERASKQMSCQIFLVVFWILLN